MPKQGDIGGWLAQCRALCDRSDEVTQDDLANHRTLIARQKARDEARRRGETEQATLPLDEAA